VSPRQARRERRAAERKERKAEIRRMKAAACFPPKTPNGTTELSGFVSQTSPTRAEINRANAQYSTGPRSETGKLALSRNALKHGLASGALLIPGEDPAAFEAVKTALLEEHQPATETETLLVTEMAQSWWLMQRAIRLQNDCFGAHGVDEKRLALFLRYQTTHERAFHKALNTIVKLKLIRARACPLGQAVPKPGFVPQNPTQPIEMQVGQTISSSATGLWTFPLKNVLDLDCFLLFHVDR
jgi:hypothetical protein